MVRSQGVSQKNADQRDEKVDPSPFSVSVYRFVTWKTSRGHLRMLNQIPSTFVSRIPQETGTRHPPPRVETVPVFDLNFNFAHHTTIDQMGLKEIPSSTTIVVPKPLASPASPY